jgi:hypothetical protein
MGIKLFLLILAFSQLTTCDLLTRSMLFDDAKYSQVTISPDGRLIAFLAPNEYGISNVYTKCIQCKDAKPATFELRRHISGYHWTGVPNIVLYSQDADGDENLRLYKINVTDVSNRFKGHKIRRFSPHRLLKFIQLAIVPVSELLLLTTTCVATKSW